MDEALQSGGLTGGEAPPSAPASPVEPTPAEPTTPQYLTRDEALSLVEDALSRQRQAYEIAAREMGARGAQSFVDKARLGDRLKSVETAINQMVSDGLIDASQASTYRERARLEALTDLLPEGPTAGQPEPQQAGGTPPPAVDPLQQRAERLLNESGLTPQDPEYHTLFGYDDPFAWFQALEQAKATKAARLTRAAAAQPKPPPTAQPATPPPAPTGAVVVEVGAGGGAVVMDLASLRKQYQAAVHKGDRVEAGRLYDLIQKAIKGG